MEHNRLKYFSRHLAGRLTMALLLVSTLLSCSADYRQTVPENCQALMAVDLSHSLGPEGMDELKSKLRVENISDCGIDGAEPIYIFETHDGRFGCVAKTDSREKLEEWLGSLVPSGQIQALSERKGLSFFLLKGSMMIAVSDAAVMMMGPVVETAHQELQRKMSRLLEAEQQLSPLFELLDVEKTGISAVAYAKALPQQLESMFLLGIDRQVAPKEVAVKFDVSHENHCLQLVAHPFSLHPETDRQLQTALEHYHPIRPFFADRISGEAVFSLACGMKGEDMLQLLRSNPTLRTVLMGMNTSLDMDKLIRSVDGNILLSLRSWQGEHSQFVVLAEQKQPDWTQDIDYWMQSAPPGTAIRRIPSASPYPQLSVNSGSWQLRLGISEDSLLYLATSDSLLQSVLQQTNRPLPAPVAAQVAHSRFCGVLGLEALAKQNSELKGMAAFLRSLLGKTDYIVYSIEK